MINMFFTDNQIKEIASLVEKYVDVSEHPNENNNILIESNTISLIVDGQVMLSKEFDPFILKSQIEQIPYGKNVFINKNSPFCFLRIFINSYIRDQVIGDEI